MPVRPYASSDFPAATPDLALNVAKSNVRAQRFYARPGFVAVGTSTGRYGGRDIDYVRMASAVQGGGP